MFENSIKAVVQAGIMKGDNTDKFRPDDTLTRYEMAVILQNAFHLTVKQATFSMMFQIIIGQKTLFVHCIVMASQTGLETINMAEK